MFLYPHAIPSPSLMFGFSAGASSGFSSHPDRASSLPLQHISGLPGGWLPRRELRSHGDHGTFLKEIPHTKFNRIHPPGLPPV